ncbi:MAG: hypothetical protein ACXWD3_08580 [Mycobacterium sp.]
MPRPSGVTGRNHYRFEIGPDGRIIETIPYIYQSAAWIEDAYTVTYVLEVGGGCAVTSQINVFRR